MDTRVDGLTRVVRSSVIYSVHRQYPTTNMPIAILKLPSYSDC